ncbi:hypothetical protein AAG906_016741 [Vitis piasezkii]
MQKSRVSSEYHKGVLEFLDFAFTNAPGKEMLPCPCIRCNNCVMQKREIITNESDMHDEMEEMLNDAFGMSMPNEESERSPHVHEEFEKPNKDANKFYNLLREADHELYPRWKSSDDNSTDEFTKSVKKKKIHAKVLRYFPLKPRLQRLYMSSKTASHMKWHVDGRMEEPRNVRLGLASDGFNPFGNMSISYSMWPVVLIPYNLPPWMCMKQTFFMLSLLIPGPTAPGNDIDIYLQPLIDELNDLWEVGVETYDASTKQNFCMRAAILWTINDFPAYANLSGWSTKGKFACPICNKDCSSYRLQNGRKWCYMGHRRFLPIDHRFRRDKKSFDGNEEHRAAPKHLSRKIIDGKSNDNFNSRLDLQAMGIRDQLHPIQRGNRVMLPAACYSLTSNEKKEFCKFLKEVKVPDGYASNISRCHLENDIIVTLCKLERIFPPSFFDVMVHLPIHLASEAKIIGPMQYRWMYPIEWYLRTLKSYVRNKSRRRFYCERHKQSIRVKPRIRARDVDLFHEKNSLVGLKNENWHTVVEIQTRGVYDMNQKVSTNDPEPYQQFITLHSQRDVHELIENDLINWDRNDIAKETIQTDEMSHRRGRVQIVSPEDELDNLQQLLDIQLVQLLLLVYETGKKTTRFNTRGQVVYDGKGKDCQAIWEHWCDLNTMYPSKFKIGIMLVKM